MGSLVGGWDANKPHSIPKGFEDYKDPFMPSSQRMPFPSKAREEPARSSSAMDRPGSPPNLARTSAPAVHGASTLQRYLSRSSSSKGASAPSTPREPRPGSPRGRAVARTMTLKLCDDDEEPAGSLLAKEKWCSRVDSATLNLRPDEGDEAVWRHGSFRVNDPFHTMHLQASPTVEQGAAPMTPPAAAAEAGPPARRPAVTVTRM